MVWWSLGILTNLQLHSSAICDALCVLKPVDHGQRYIFLILAPVYHNIKIDKALLMSWPIGVYIDILHIFTERHMAHNFFSLE